MSYIAASLVQMCNFMYYVIQMYLNSLTQNVSYIKIYFSWCLSAHSLTITKYIRIIKLDIKMF